MRVEECSFGLFYLPCLDPAVSAPIQNPLEFLREDPLAFLLPERGGFDPETGNSNIRQSLELQIFGRTVSGKAIATEKVSIGYNFVCSGK